MPGKHFPGLQSAEQKKSYKGTAVEYTEGTPLSGTLRRGALLIQAQESATKNVYSSFVPIKHIGILFSVVLNGYVYLSKWELPTLSL